MDLHTLTEAPFATDDDVRTLLAAFHNGSLPRSAWNHRAHMTVALSFGRAFAAAAALNGMRDAILRYNASVGIVSTPDEGFHESITVFYMHLVGVHVARHAIPGSLALDANTFMDDWGRPTLPFDYYSKQRLFSRRARAQWEPPDLQPLPVVQQLR
jgi:hypothetical protein